MTAPTLSDIVDLAKKLGLPTGGIRPYNNTPQNPRPALGDMLDHGYFVVDSVIAAQGNYKANATGWSVDIVAAVMTADYANATDGKDYIVIDAKGRVVA